MDDLLKRAWWMLVLRGAVGLLFGFCALFWPGLTLLLLISLFAAYALIGGVAAAAAAIRHRATLADRWLPLALGVCSVVAGVIALVAPGITAFVLIVVIGANALVTGISDLIAAFRLRKRGRLAWRLFAVIGVLSTLFGLFVLLFPGAGALALVWAIGTYALLTGALLFVLGLTARGWQREVAAHKPATPLHP